MTTKLHYVGDKSCPVCDKTRAVHQEIADKAGIELVEHELDVLATEPGTMRDYVVHYHVDEEGMIQLPTYIITVDHRIQASCTAKDGDDIEGLLKAWSDFEESLRVAEMEQGASGK